MNVLFIFIDGLGLPTADENSPVHAALDGFQALSGGQRWSSGAAEIVREDLVFRGIDARLGVAGLPQSGTGQASLFTGINCAAMAGRHYGPYPHSATRAVLASHNVFARVQALRPAHAAPVAFANAYPDRFFEFARRRNWWTVTTRCCLDAGVPIRNAAMLARGEAISADITGRGWPQADPRVEPISEEIAAGRLLQIARHHVFTLFEYYLTDKAGHARDEARAQSILVSVDRLLSAIRTGMDPERDLLLISSDHGNIEDLSTKSHTINPVPLVAYGAGAGHFAAVRDLTGVVPALMDALAAEEKGLEPRRGG